MAETSASIADPISDVKVKVQAELKSRCSPKQIVKIMNHIRENEELIRAVEQMGFGSLGDVPDVKMDLKFIKKLVDGFDVDSCSIFGEKIEAKDVGVFLGIPAVGNLVPTSISDAVRDNFKEKFAGKSLCQLKLEINSFTRADRTFEETFILFALGHFLCPCVKDVPSQELYKALSVVSVARQYNWGQFVLGFLLEAIKDYKKRIARNVEIKGNVGIGGCIHFLKVFFLQRMSPLDVDSNKPVVSAWTNKDVIVAIKRDPIQLAKKKMNDNYMCAGCTKLKLRIEKLEQMGMINEEDNMAAAVHNSLKLDSQVDIDVIYLYGRYLMRTISRAFKFLIYSPYDYKKLEVTMVGSESTSDDPLYLLKLWEGNFYEYPYILFPVCKDLHYSLTIVCFPNEKEGEGLIMINLDSSSLHDSDIIFNHIEWFLKQKWKGLKGETSELPTIVRKIAKVPQQPNTKDCGFFVMYMMELFLKQAPERFKTNDLEMFGENWFKVEDACALRRTISPIMEEEMKRDKQRLSSSRNDASVSEQSHPGPVNSSVQSPPLQSSPLQSPPLQSPEHVSNISAATPQSNPSSLQKTPAPVKDAEKTPADMAAEKPRLDSIDKEAAEHDSIDKEAAEHDNVAMKRNLHRRTTAEDTANVKDARKKLRSSTPKEASPHVKDARKRQLRTTVETRQGGRQKKTDVIYKEQNLRSKISPRHVKEMAYLGTSVRLPQIGDQEENMDQ